MEEELEVLEKAILFAGKTPAAIRAILRDWSLTPRACRKNEVIFAQGDAAGYMGIVLSGAVEVQKALPSGKTVSLARFTPGQSFGEAVLFAREGKYPGMVVAVLSSRILLLPKTALLCLFAADPVLMERFMESLSEHLLLLNRKIELLSMGTLSQKVAGFLLKEAKDQQTRRIRLPFSIRSCAEHLNVPRPSLSRELCAMRDKGWINPDGHYIELLDVVMLQSQLN